MLSGLLMDVLANERRNNLRSESAGANYRYTMVTDRITI